MKTLKSGNRWTQTLLYLSAPMINLATAPILARSMGPVGRGQYGVALALSAFALSIGGLGQADVFISRARENMTAYQSNLRISVWGASISSAIAIFYGQSIGLPLILIIAACAWNPLLTLANLWRSTSIASDNDSRPAYSVFFSQILRLGFLVALLLGHFLNPVSAAVATQLPIVAGSFIFLFITRKKWKIAGPGFIKAELIRGFPILGFNLLLALVMKSDVLVLQLRSNAPEVGLYSAVVSLTAAGLALSASFKNRIQSALARNDFERFNFELKIAFVGSIITAIGIFSLSDVLVRAILGDAFLGAIPIMKVMAFATGTLMMLDVIVGSLIALGSTRKLYLVAAFGAFLTLTSLYFLSAPFGAIGACFGTLAGYAGASIFGFIYLKNSLLRS